MLKKIFGKQNDTFLIAGLGNPEHKYDNTRHNIGFMAIDKISSDYNIPLTIKKHKGLIGKGTIEGHKVILVKPLTFMNSSGECIGKVAAYEKIDTKNNVLVICDDIHLPVGKLRLRKKGSAGGHNGLKDIIFHLGGEDFKRLKIGVGEVPKYIDQINYVLGKFDKQELEVLNSSIEKISKNVPIIIKDIDNAMNSVNG